LLPVGSGGGSVGGNPGVLAVVSAGVSGVCPADAPMITHMTVVTQQGFIWGNMKPRPPVRWVGLFSAPRPSPTDTPDTYSRAGTPPPCRGLGRGHGPPSAPGPRPPRTRAAPPRWTRADAPSGLRVPRPAPGSRPARAGRRSPGAWAAATASRCAAD